MANIKTERRRLDKELRIAFHKIDCEGLEYYFLYYTHSYLEDFRKEADEFRRAHTALVNKLKALGYVPEGDED